MTQLPPPLQPPQPPVLGYADFTTVPFESSGARAKVAKYLLVALVCVQALVSLAGSVITLSGMEPGAGDTVPGWMMVVEMGLIAASLLWLLLFIVSIVFFCRWMHLVHRNAFALGIQQPRFSSG